jgi:alkylated DNA repair protein (DNA oxidative demethylase)
MEKKPMELPQMAPDLRVRGVAVYKGFLDRTAQEDLVQALRAVARAAPFYRPVTPSGRAMSVRMTAAGRFGWVSDRAGYRYAPRHPGGADWPPIPGSVLGVWTALVPGARAPECCLVNFYDAGAKMGLHQDRDEADFSQPVLSISLGDAARFRVGATTRGGPTESLWLDSGDVAVMAGDARLAYHGIDRIKPGSSTLLPEGGRINLTLRVVT